MTYAIPGTSVVQTSTSGLVNSSLAQGQQGLGMRLVGTVPSLPCDVWQPIMSAASFWKEKIKRHSLIREKNYIHTPRHIIDTNMNTALNAIVKLAIPAAVGFSLFQASVYDVRGGTRAVIFDRLSGVKDEVCVHQ